MHVRIMLSASVAVGDDASVGGEFLAKVSREMHRGQVQGGERVGHDGTASGTGQGCGGRRWPGPAPAAAPDNHGPRQGPGPPEGRLAQPWTSAGAVVGTGPQPGARPSGSGG